MKIIYYPETDPMFIDLSSKESAESSVVFPDIVFDYDVDGNQIVGITILNASSR